MNVILLRAKTGGCERSQYLLRALAYATIVLGLSACNTLLSPAELYPAALPIDRPPPPKTNGTIFQAGHEVRLFQDQVAFRVGDVLTVRLEEATSAQYKADTKTSKTAQLSYPTPTVFGITPLNYLNVNTNTDQEFQGKGDSDQSGKLTGIVTVTVINVLSNSNMIVQGESWVTLNQGQGFVQVYGIVRAEDIQPNNVISSQRIANAKITYGARGQAGYASSGGLATRLFNRFFPF
ncbi:MAG: flagellar basal body L-ring protein FlgH [Legionellales bacterium]